MNQPSRPGASGPSLPEPWHIKREIQVGHLITTLTVAAAAVIYAGKLEQRIALVEQQVVAQRDRDERQDQASAAALTALRAQLDRMDSKLDRLVERQERRP